MKKNIQTEMQEEKSKSTKPSKKTITKKEIPKSEPPPVVVDVDATTNKFIVETNICEPWAVANFTMPKLLFTKNIQSNDQKIKEKSTVMLELHYVTKPNQPLSIVKAAKNGVEKLKLHHIDDAGSVQSTWSFLNCRIAGIDFGVLSYESDGTEEKPWNQIKIEIEYEQLMVDSFEV